MSDPKYAPKASQSFTVDEVNALDAIFSTLLRGGDVRILIRSKAASTLPRKILAMRGSIARQQRLSASEKNEAAQWPEQPADTTEGA